MRNCILASSWNIHGCNLLRRKDVKCYFKVSFKMKAFQFYWNILIAEIELLNETQVDRTFILWQWRCRMDLWFNSWKKAKIRVFQVNLNIVIVMVQHLIKHKVTLNDLQAVFCDIYVFNSRCWYDFFFYLKARVKKKTKTFSLIWYIMIAWDETPNNR